MNLKDLYKKFRTIFEPGPRSYDPRDLGLTAPDLKKKLQLSQLAQMKHHSSASILTRFIFCVLFACLTWDSIGGGVMALWVGFVLMHSLAGIKSTDDFFECPDVEKQFKFWKNRSLQMVFVSGLSFGFAGFYFMIPGNTEVQMLVIALIIGVSFGSMSLYACWLPAFWAFLPTVLLPTMVKLAMIYNISFGVAAFWVGIILLILWYFSTRLNEIYSLSLFRNFEKEYLVEELVQQRQAAELAKEAAEMAIVSKTKFFAAANHDLRQPLQAMGIFISVLEAQVPPDSKPLVDNLSQACNQVATLVDQILILSKLDSRSIKINPTTFSLDEVFEEMKIEFSSVAETKGIQFVLDPISATICTDAQLLERVIRNLLSNAFRYTSSGKVVLRARCGLKDTLVIIVADTGNGIDKSEKLDLFKEYYRGKSGYQAKEGYGLGLSIVKKICDLLDFSISFRSKKGSGTVFRVVVTLSRDLHQVKLLNKPEHSKSFFSLKGKRILIIEDDPLIRRSVQALLEAWGAKVKVAEHYDAQLAAEIVVSNPLDLILTDFNLGPGHLTGLQATLRIRSAVGKRIPAIVMSATPREEVMRHYEEETEGLNFSEYGTDLTDLPTILQKPVSPNEINKAISRLLNTKHT